MPGCTVYCQAKWLITLLQIVPAFVYVPLTWQKLSVDLNHSILFSKLIERPVFLFVSLKFYVIGTVNAAALSNGATVFLIRSLWIKVFDRLGVLSRILFSVYCDDALCHFPYSVLGCYPAGLMISSSDVCGWYFTHELHLLNLCKTLFARASLRLMMFCCTLMWQTVQRWMLVHDIKSPCASLESLDGSTIPWLIEFRYLGVVLTQGTLLKVNVHHNKVNFFKAFNNVYGKLGNSSSAETIVHLMEVNCLSAMLYNLESVNLTKTDISKLEFSLGRVYVKMFHVRR